MKIDHYISQCAKYVLAELNEVIFLYYLHIKPHQNIYISLTADTNKVSFKCKIKT